MPGSPDEDGAARWLLYDPLRNQYFTLAETAVKLLEQWQPDVTLDQFSQHLQTMDNACTSDEAEAFIQFLSANHLTEARSGIAVEQLYQQHTKQQRTLWQWLLHNYLFIRIPLVRPDAWLTRCLPHMNGLFSPVLHYLLLLLGLAGSLMVIRQWDDFLATFQYFFSLKGLMLYGLTLIIVKSAHELGHAFAAKRQGCRVPSMGIAFLVLFPVLYTDTTDAWRLTSRSKRLRIVTAGVRVELYLALLATFLWSIVPEGALKSVMFFVATTSWITSVLVNISPFLRFDGYYALSDWLGMENLQQRGFAVGRWALRKSLFGLQDPLPEPLTRDRTRLLIFYAWGTWLYRFFLFLGIALLVYHLFFKVLGIFLFIVEILWFIVLPIWRETRVWWQRRREFAASRSLRLLQIMVALVIMACIIPLPGRIDIPAVLKAENNLTLFAPEDARITKINVQEGDRVQEGQLLLTLESSALRYELQQVKESIDLIRIRLRRNASSRAERDSTAIMRQQQIRLNEKLAGLQSRINQLQVKAPFSGRVTQLSDLHAGIWVGTSTPLLSIVDPEVIEIEGYINAADVELTQIEDTGYFIADNRYISALPVRLESIDIGATYDLPYAELTSEYNGNIAVRRMENDVLIPEQEWYRTHITVSPHSSARPVVDRLSGVVVISGRWNSWLWSQVKRLTAIIIRESGF